MSDVINLVDQAKKHGATFILENNRLILQAPNPLPPVLVDELRNHKAEIQQYLKLGQVKREENWLLEEWRRLSIPGWRRILRESIEGKDKSREEYARWMLREVLEDPEYREQP